jgi:hypothetical protein
VGAARDNGIAKRSCHAIFRSAHVNHRSRFERYRKECIRGHCGPSLPCLQCAFVSAQAFKTPQLNARGPCHRPRIAVVGALAKTFVPEKLPRNHPRMISIGKLLFQPQRYNGFQPVSELLTVGAANNLEFAVVNNTNQ